MLYRGRIIAILFFVAAACMPSYTVAETLIVGTIERPPFVMHDAAGALTGFSVELWDAIAQRAELSYVWKEEAVFKDMLNDVEKGATDVAAANISITEEREKVLDFTQPMYQSGLQIMVNTTVGHVSLFTLVWQSGVIQVVLFALVLLLIIAHVVWFFERNVSDKRHAYFRDDYVGGVWDAFWWAFVVMTMGGFEREVPHKIISRVLAVVWIVASIFVISTITAKITTALTVNALSSSIHSYDDLRGLRVGIAEGTTMEQFVKNVGLSYTPVSDLNVAMHAVARGDLDATIGDAPVVQYFVTHEGKGAVRLAGNVFAPDAFGIALTERSPYYERVNQALIALLRDGSYDTLYKKYFGE